MTLFRRLTHHLWGCRHHRLAVIVPLRDREAHLEVFVPRLQATLNRQRIDYDLFIVEQTPHRSFNRGKLFNVGVAHTTDQDYFCFHDVDLLPESDRRHYRYARAPTHLAAYCSQFDYRLPYPACFGGVILMNRADFLKINGFSNNYWGWGGEDDDLRVRCVHHNLWIRRRSGRYTSLPHAPHEKVEAEYQNNLRRLEHLRLNASDALTDGYNTLSDYAVVAVTRQPAYTRILVRFD